MPKPPNPDGQPVRINILLPPTLKRRFDDHCRKSGKKKATVIRKLVEGYLEQEKS